mmetsp:Transcript_32950/g.63303  ORF Transcript_32950/g.63303 Transcript_32950/m.63303 type:complete len:252 (-) Transcript_32950:581-1336(-)
MCSVARRCALMSTLTASCVRSLSSTHDSELSTLCSTLLWSRLRTNTSAGSAMSCTSTSSCNDMCLRWPRQLPMHVLSWNAILMSASATATSMRQSSSGSACSTASLPRSSITSDTFTTRLTAASALATHQRSPSPSSPSASSPSSSPPSSVALSVSDSSPERGTKAGGGLAASNSTPAMGSTGPGSAGAWQRCSVSRILGAVLVTSLCSGEKITADWVNHQACRRRKATFFISVAAQWKRGSHIGTPAASR